MLMLRGDVSAGFPKASEGYEDTPLNLHDWLVRHPAATFFHRVQGDALKSENIRSGSILVVDRSLVPPPGKLKTINGKLVLIECDGDSVVCRFQQDHPTRGVLKGIVVAVVTRY